MPEDQREVTGLNKKELLDYLFEARREAGFQKTRPGVSNAQVSAIAGMESAVNRLIDEINSGRFDLSEGTNDISAVPAPSGKKPPETTSIGSTIRAPS